MSPRVTARPAQRSRWPPRWGQTRRARALRRRLTPSRRGSRSPQRRSYAGPHDRNGIGELGRIAAVQPTFPGQHERGAGDESDRLGDGQRFQDLDLRFGRHTPIAARWAGVRFARMRAASTDCSDFAGAGDEYAGPVSGARFTYAVALATSAALPVASRRIHGAFLPGLAAPWPMRAKTLPSGT